jgi:hypothetical protein
MKDKAVVVFEMDEILRIKQIIMDGEEKEALAFLKKIIKKVEEAENKGLNAKEGASLPK